MSLTETLKIARDQLKLNQCRVCVWLETIDSEDRLSIEDWIRESLPQTSLREVCHSYGLEASATTFRNHIHECVLKDRACR